MERLNFRWQWFKKNHEVIQEGSRETRRQKDCPRCTFLSKDSALENIRGNFSSLQLWDWRVSDLSLSRYAPKVSFLLSQWTFYETPELYLLSIKLHRCACHGRITSFPHLAVLFLNKLKPTVWLQSLMTSMPFPVGLPCNLLHLVSNPVSSKLTLTHSLGGSSDMAWHVWP